MSGNSTPNVRRVATALLSRTWVDAPSKMHDLLRKEKDPDAWTESPTFLDRALAMRFGEIYAFEHDARAAVTETTQRLLNASGLGLGVKDLTTLANQISLETDIRGAATLAVNAMAGARAPAGFSAPTAADHVASLDDVDLSGMCKKALKDRLKQDAPNVDTSGSWDAITLSAAYHDAFSAQVAVLETTEIVANAVGLTIRGTQVAVALRNDISLTTTLSSAVAKMRGAILSLSADSLV
jgi:hypothetical protein